MPADQGPPDGFGGFGPDPNADVRFWQGPSNIVVGTPPAPQPPPAGSVAQRQEVTVSATKDPPPKPKAKAPPPHQEVDPETPAAPLPPKSDQIPVPAGHRRPRGILRVNGKLCSCISFQAETKAHFTAGTWSAELEPWNQPEGFGLKYWSDIGTADESASPDVLVDVLIGALDDTQDAGEHPKDWTALMTGQVDSIIISPNEGKLTISGRDLTARMIDTKTSQKWPNQTASQIATYVAQGMGLTPNVTATKTPVGQYYHDEYAQQSRDIPYWDLLTFLAEQEGFDVFVKGTTLYFGPPLADLDQHPWTVYVVRDDRGRAWSNATYLQFQRSLTLARDISVTVLSHSSATGKGIKAVAKRAGAKSASSSASRGAENTQSYVLRRPGITQEQAQQIANQYLAALTRQERTFEVRMEGLPSLDVHTRKGKLTGTDTSYDGEYYFDTLTHTFSAAAGYEIEANLKNHPTASEPANI